MGGTAIDIVTTEKKSIPFHSSMPHQLLRSTWDNAQRSASQLLIRRDARELSPPSTPCRRDSLPSHPRVALPQLPASVGCARAGRANVFEVPSSNPSSRDLQLSNISRMQAPILAGLGQTLQTTSPASSRKSPGSFLLLRTIMPNFRPHRELLGLLRRPTEPALDPKCARRARTGNHQPLSDDSGGVLRV